MASLREVYPPLAATSARMASKEDCGSLFANLKAKKIITEKYSVRHFLGIRQGLETGELEKGVAPLSRKIPFFRCYHVIKAICRQKN